MFENGLLDSQQLQQVADRLKQDFTENYHTAGVGIRSGTLLSAVSEADTSVQTGDPASISIELADRERPARGKERFGARTRFYAPRAFRGNKKRQQAGNYTAVFALNEGQVGRLSEDLARH